MLKNKIPLELLDGEIKEPGFVEADTVAHCGNNIAGEYAHTLTVTDLFSGWTEQVYLDKALRGRFGANKAH